MGNLAVHLVEVFAPFDEHDELFVLFVEICTLPDGNFRQKVADRSGFKLSLGGGEGATGNLFPVSNFFQGINVSIDERFALALEQVEQNACVCVQAGEFLA